MLGKFIIQQKDRNPWEGVRIAKDPLGVRATMGDLIDKDLSPLSTTHEITDAFQRHHLITTGEEVPIVVSAPAPFRTVTGERIETVHNALTRRASNSSPGPGRVNYRLLKLIRHAAREGDNQRH